MKNKDESYKKIVETLWVEINRAILGSPNVKSSLADLRALGLLKEIGEYNLVVDVNKMVEMMLDNPESGERPHIPQISPDTQEAHLKRDDSFDEFSLAELFLEEDPTSPESREDPKAQGNPDETGRSIRQCIDGKPLSKNQIHFQEYLEHRFDMETWLKKARIRF